MDQISKALDEAQCIPPRFRATLLERNRITLRALLTDGLLVPAGKKENLTTHVRFKQVGKTFKPRQGTGWWAVRVKSIWGAISTLLLDDAGTVSGLLRLKR